MTHRTLLLTLLFTAASPALAQGKPTLIDYPLDLKVPVPQAQQDELQNDFRQLLARTRGLMLSTKSHWKVSVAALKRADCDVRDECLQQLATTAGTLYALYASVEQNAAGTEVTATGRVVNQDRLQVRSRLTFTVPRKASKASKTGLSDAARDALGRLLGALELEKLPATLSAPAPEVPVSTAATNRPPEDLVLVVPAFPVTASPSPLAATVEQKQPEPRGGRVAAFVVGGLGVAAAGVAVGFGLSAAMGRGALPSDGRLLDDGQARTQAAVNRDATVCLTSALGAAALLGTATVLFITSAPPSTPVLSLAPIPGGAHLTLTGEFGP